jgi:hypothetical protein
MKAPEKIFVHGIIAWRPIPKFSEELLLKAQKG